MQRVHFVMTIVAIFSATVVAVCDSKYLVADENGNRILSCDASLNNCTDRNPTGVPGLSQPYAAIFDKGQKELYCFNTSKWTRHEKVSRRRRRVQVDPVFEHNSPAHRPQAL